MSLGNDKVQIILEILKQGTGGVDAKREMEDVGKTVEGLKEGFEKLKCQG